MLLACVCVHVCAHVRVLSCVCRVSKRLDNARARHHLDLMPGAERAPPQQCAAPAHAARHGPQAPCVAGGRV